MITSTVTRTVPLLAAFAMAACVSATPTPEPERAPAPRPDPVDVPPELTPGAEEGLAIGTLPAQALEAGQCGLFLFTPRPSPRFIFFAEASTGVARIMLNGTETALARTTVEGSLVDQHYTTQAYTSGNGIEVAVEFTPGRTIEGGTEVERGKIRIDRADGWSVVLPVSGATNCQGA